MHRYARPGYAYHSDEKLRLFCPDYTPESCYIGPHVVTASCPGHKFLVLDTNMEEHLKDEHHYYIDNTMEVIDVSLISEGKESFASYELDGIRDRFQRADGILGRESSIKRVAIEVFVTHGTGVEKDTATRRNFDFACEIKVRRSTRDVPGDFFFARVSCMRRERARGSDR